MEGKFTGQFRVARFILLASVGMLAAIDTAAAQTAENGAKEQPAATQEQPGDAGGDIVVTAQRRAQSLKEVPIAVTVIDSSAIQNLNLSTIDTVARITPGFTFTTGYSFSQAYIRGVGVSTGSNGLEAPVALYVDGAYVPRGTGVLLDLFDVDSVQILKGPQGTLYGKNASGGAILVQTADPEWDTSAQALLEYGRFNHIKAEAVLNTQISDNLAIRLGAQHVDEDGYIRNLTTGNRVRERSDTTLRGKLKFRGARDLVATLTLEYSRGSSHALAGGRQINPPPLCAFCGIPGADTNAGFYEMTQDYEAHDKRRSYRANFKVTDKFGDFSVTSVTAYQDTSATLGNDVDETPLPFFALNGQFSGKNFSQDLNLSSSFGGAFDFLVGAQYSHDDAQVPQYYFGTLFGLPYSNSQIPATAAYTNNFIKTESVAIFAEAYIKPVEALTITVGGRYSHDYRHLRGDTNAIARAIFNPGGTSTYSQSVKFDKFTPRVVIAYDTGPVNLFASYTRGYKAGGFNTPAFGIGDPVLPETMDNFELGAKFESADRRTRLNVAAFRYTYKDLQVQNVDSASGGQVITNAASARGHGVEVELSQKVGQWLSLSAGGAYLDAKYKNYPNGLVATVVRDALGNPLGLAQTNADLSGTPLSRAPKWTAFLSGTLEAPIANGWLARLSGNAHYSSRFNFSPAAGGELGLDTQKAFTLVDLSGGIGPESKAYEIGFYINNLFNQKSFDQVATGTFAAVQFPAMPRTFGVRLKTHL